ncbi:MAG: phospho-sugar mutase [Deltaproteobacteria bacterium]|nr:phospho-sugar mutase [Deltaproteobacteria bacterium]
MSEPLERARAWIRDDPDPDDRAELAALVARAEARDAAASRELLDRFSGPLEFGTAGLRGVVAAGESRFNRAVILRATAGLCAHVLSLPNAGERGIVIGHDARRSSQAMAIAAAEVAAARGLRVHLLLGPSPTPLVAFGVKALGAAAGVAVTASHNPPEYNGYKVYLDRGSQIVPPHDAEIAAQIAQAPAAKDVPRLALEEARARGRVTDARGIEALYIEAVLGLRRLEVAADRLRIAYTPLHGVGERLTREVFARAEYRRFHSVPEQSEPDGSFPTVRFPNPEEPGALDRVVALAEQVDADLILAQDPDADRLAAGARNAQGRFQILTGNELGVLLAHHVLTREGPPEPRELVVTTVVSSAQLGHIARALGVRYAECLTGFKWIAHTAMEIEAREGVEFAFGFEEALGYTIGSVVRDKDGIGAALVMAELAADAKAHGETIFDRLRTIRERYGLFVSRQRSIVLPGREGAARIRSVMQRLHGSPLRQVGGLAVDRSWDLERRRRDHRDGTSEPMEHLPPADVVILELEDGSRAAVRPSGTEPKVKLYLEVRESLAAHEPLEDAERRAATRLDGLERALLDATGLKDASLSVG